MSFGGDSASGDFNRQGRRHALARISARLRHERRLAQLCRPLEGFESPFFLPR
jgi:hypothetical protein